MQKTKELAIGLEVLEINLQERDPQEFSALNTAKLENGWQVAVPINVRVGEKVFINPTTKKYEYSLRRRSKLKVFSRTLRYHFLEFLNQLFVLFFFPQRFFQLLKIFTVPGKILPESALLLLHSAEEDLGEGAVVEIGSFKGRSTACLCMGNRKNKHLSRVLSVDPHFENTYEIFRKNMQRLGYIGDIDIYKMTSVEAIEDWKGKIRLLWIDGNHEYIAVKEDLLLWGRHLTDGGILLMDDSNSWGVKAVIEEFLLNTKEYSCLGRVGQVTYAVKGQHEPYAYFSQFKRLQNAREKLTPILKLLRLK